MGSGGDSATLINTPLEFLIKTPDGVEATDPSWCICVTNAMRADAPPLTCRVHDLRHSVVSRMLDAGVPIAKVAKIVG
jgi:hypothetical protein